MAEKTLDLAPIIEWLDAGAAPARRSQEVLQHLCQRLVGGGIALHRVAVFVRTLHPNVAGRAFIWHAANNLVEIVTAALGIQDTEQYQKSPGFAKAMNLEEPPVVSPLYANPLDKFKEKGLHQWGMSIDLSSCVGC